MQEIPRALSRHPSCKANEHSQLARGQLDSRGKALDNRVLILQLL